MNTLTAVAIGLGFGIAIGCSGEWWLGTALGLMMAVVLSSGGRRR